MAGYRQMNKQELLAEKAQLEKAYAGYQAKGLKLNMARGKPGAEQLAISMPMLDTLNSKSNCKSEAGVDCRNYGELTGIAEARALFGEYMGIPAEQTLVMGSASLTFMYDCVARAMLTGVLGSEKPWGKYDKVKFLCPVPGYDRHFTICEFLGIEMINIPLTEWGPDVELIQKLVAEDDSIKGMWCVPKYTNPLGGVYSDEAVRALANLKPKAKDFRIFWDNAYAMHYIYRDVPLLNIIDECAKAGNPDRVYVFGSTSKITFPGAGVAFFGASKANVDFTVKQLNAQAISWDKLNMLRHVRYFKNLDGIRAQMELHAQVLRPKFDAVLDALDSELTERGVGRWVKPEGGYFVTYIAESGCATRIVGLCKQAGVVLTEAGATHPYHKDPDDAYIRIAPSFPSPAELANAMEIFCLSARLAMVEKLLG
ncbi:MAG: aminotransferase class I/II-fold pyridoxal phosphate-dependent enzyme [Oscillospiraceae bacterium]